MHALLFLLIAACTLYVLIAATMDQITWLTWIAFGVVCLEMGILIWNDWQCPLTLFAEERGALKGSVADLFLPKPIADHLFKIFGVLFGISTLMLIWRVI